MKVIDTSHARGRGAILGLAFLSCTAALASDSALRDEVHRLFRHQSYILVEAPSEPARLLVLSSNPTTHALSGDDAVLRQALIDFTSVDPAVREDAVLSLADIDVEGVVDILASALADPSPFVRDTAAAVLEELSEIESTDFDDGNSLIIETSTD